MFKTGDLIRTTRELIVRRDGWTFSEDDVPDGKVPRDWLDGADEVPAGTLCTFLRLGEEDPTYVVARRDLIGRPLVIRSSLVELQSSIDDALSIEPADSDWMEPEYQDAPGPSEADG